MFLVAERTVRCADLELGERPPDCRQERLLGDAPCRGERGEHSPTVPADEARRTVVTEVRLEKVTLLVVVVQTPEERCHGPSGCGFPSCSWNFVVAAGADDLIVGIGEILPVGPRL